MCEQMKISGVEKLGINNLGRYVVYDFPIWEEKKYDCCEHYNDLPFMCEQMKISGVEKLGINNLGRYVVYDFPIWEEKKYDYCEHFLSTSTIK